MDIYQFELPEQLSSDPITYFEGYLRDSITQLPVPCTVMAKGFTPIKTDAEGRFFLCLKAGDTLQVRQGRRIPQLQKPVCGNRNGRTAPPTTSTFYD